MALFGMDLGPHWIFIVLAYAVAIIGVAALIAWVIIDARLQRATIAELERRGVRRRSRQGTSGE